MKLIVGLGNPGLEYERTRHNAGFLAADELARRHAPGEPGKGRFHAVTLEARIGTEKAVLLKPTTFMNRSGQAVGEALRFFKLEPAEDLLVMVDEVALPTGMIRLRMGGGANGHNGIKDIDRALGGAEYARLRIGVDKPPAMINKIDWVLGRFHEDEAAAVESGTKAAADAAALWASEGIDAAMNMFNKKVEGGAA